MQNSARWVLPVMSVSRCRSARSTAQGRWSHVIRPVDQPLDLGEGDLQLVQGLRPTLVDPRRLAGRADEPAREQVRQRRVVLPVGEHADQQVGPPQQRRLARLGAARG